MNEITDQSGPSILPDAIYPNRPALHKSGMKFTGANSRVCAVVVTYNRKNLLQECLQGLFRQTRPLDGIILVDNSSTDGTPEFLYSLGLIKEKPPSENSILWEIRTDLNLFSGNLLYIRLPENEGGAGGFHEGLKRACEEDFEWMWLMDDDVEAYPDCLERLLGFGDISKCIHPNKVFADGKPHEWEGYISLRTGKRIFQPNPSFKKGFEFATTNTGTFEGMLVHREIVQKVGLPDKRFFLGSDDSLFGFMAHFHTPVLYTRSPLLKKKKIYIETDNPISDRSIYYGMRNVFLFQRTMNELVPKYRMLRRFFIFVKFFDYTLNILQNRKEKLKGFQILLFAVRDGILGRFGKGI
jgi:GT2 family glycosyltransferase